MSLRLPAKVSPDKGTKRLIDDLLDILGSAQKNEFHDFKSSRTSPKGTLISCLEAMIGAAKGGQYDNPADDEDARKAKRQFRQDFDGLEGVQA